MTVDATLGRQAYAVRLISTAIAGLGSGPLVRRGADPACGQEFYGRIARLLLVAITQLVAGILNRTCGLVPQVMRTLLDFSGQVVTLSRVLKFFIAR